MTALHCRVGDRFTTIGKDFEMARINRVSRETDPLQWHNAPVSAQQNIEARFMIGRDRMGRWIVKDREGNVGGMFVNESAALHFAREAADYDVSQVCKAAEGQILELGILSGIRTQIIH
ncbi:hypothetical protein FHX09_001548 [Rhizobium sp. BK538]|nr:hypothetical protein [Rhizobium sp. BK538]